MRILVAEDDRVTSRVVEHYLRKWGHEVTLCSNGRDAWELLQQSDSPNLAILDWMMPEMTGLEICNRARDLGEREYRYIILLTSMKGKDNIVEGLAAGADDYVEKPFHPSELKVRVQTGVRILELQNKLCAALKESEFKACHDPLTKMLNRGAILETVSREISRSIREGAGFGVVMADVDHFKRVNDRYGHLVGDRVLGEISRRIIASVRPYDSVGRYGGEEFMLVMPGGSDVEAWRLAERLRKLVSSTPVSTTQGDVWLTMSFGVTYAAPVTGIEADTLIQEADDALYRAKSKGRNRVEKHVRLRAVESHSALALA